MTSNITNGIDGTMTETLNYDELDRLTSVTSTADNESYTYDGDGNRLTALINGDQWTYTPSASSNRLAAAADNSWSGSYNYDPQGNLLGTSHQYWTYDSFGRMRTATPLSGSPVTTYDVNPEGQRLRKYTGTGSTWFAPDATGALMAEDDNGTWYDYVWLNGRLIGLTVAGSVYSLHDDQTGRPQVMTTPNTPSIAWAAQNLPFDRTVTTNSYGNFNPGFPGQYFDSEVGDYWYNGARDYSALLGRYVESDPTGLSGGINTYAYVGDNPISRIDSLGLDSAVFYTEPQYQMGLSGPPLQLPDVYLFEVAFGPVSASATYTRYGDAFVGLSANPTTVAQGGGFQVGGVQIAAGYLKGCDHSRQNINNVVSGFSGGASYYDGVGGGFSNNASGTIYYGGVGFGQFSAGTGFNQYQGNIFGH